MTTKYIGKPTSRVDGPAKVTGAAKYAAEFNTPGLCYGVVVSSAIARGTITHIDTSDALALPGVLQVFTHENAPHTAWFDRNYKDETAPPGSPFRPLHSNTMQYSGQPVALVVADTFDTARYASTLVKITYEREAHETNLDNSVETAHVPPVGRLGYKPPPAPRGDAEKAFAAAEVQQTARYVEGFEFHNPMETFASTVIYEEDGKLTIYDKTQGAPNSLGYVSKIFGLSGNDVRVLSPYVGGAFGSGLRPQYQLFLAVLAARALKRSVRVVLTRQQMFSLGYRPTCVQNISLGAAKDGKLQAILHDAFADTSQYEEYSENVVNWSATLYECPNAFLDYKIAKLDLQTPMDMRAPGATTGMFALEIALDELAYKCGIDPLELRLKNYAEKDPSTDSPHSSKELREAYRQGAERFGWNKRPMQPRSMRDGHTLTGWGMATGQWDAMQGPAKATALLSADGKLTVGSGTADIGTGTYTIMTQIAAETLGLPLEDVTFKLGDSLLPEAPIEGGSWTASSVGTAVQAVCEQIGQRVYRLAQKVEHSPLAGVDHDDIEFADGYVRRKSNPAQRVAIVDAMKHGGVGSLEETATTMPNMLKQARYSRTSHSAVFVEVKVDEELGTVRVTRIVSAIAGGRVLNPKTARSQILGGIVFGISMALHEDAYIDHNLGRFMNHNLAEYHVPVNADIHDIEIIFVPEDDDIVNPLGVKGLGEIGLIGVAAAINNAIYHATGKRVRDLPLTPDKLL